MAEKLSLAGNYNGITIAQSLREVKLRKDTYAVLIEGNGRPPMFLLRQVVKGKVRGFIENGSEVSHVEGMRRDSLVAGNSKIKGNVKFGRGVIVEGSLIETDGPAWIRDKHPIINQEIRISGGSIPY